MESKAKRTALLMLVFTFITLLVIEIQFIGPPISNPVVTGGFSAPDSIATIFKRACYDCHSNETKLNWYDKIAPVSWKVYADIKEARSRMNFSHWDSLSEPQQLAKLWYAVNMIDQDKMPLKSYRVVHPSASVSKTEIDALKKYIVSLSDRKLPVKQNVSIDTRLPAIRRVSTTTLAISPNGIHYFDDYKNWKVIATTNRFDNGTMRIIYGNDIAVRAVQQNTVNPWPNGATIVKVVWNQQPEDENGNIHPGDFNNIQIMIRDDVKYRATDGWGFARFNTLKLLPYGKTASFDIECINCHQLASTTGFVFDIPTTKITDP